MVVTRSMAAKSESPQTKEIVNSSVDDISLKLKQIYNFQDDTTSPDPNILPQPYLIRYHGMGHYQLLSKMKGDSNKYFLIMLGGSNGFDCEYNERQYVNLTEKDSISLKKAEEILGRKEF
jgi:hypothetical protein